MDANILQSFGVLILAVGVIAGVMVLIKKITAQRLEAKTTINLNVISKITLQPKNHLFVVKVAEKLLVLGVTDNNINILTELDPDDSIVSQVANPKTQATAAAAILNKVAAAPKRADNTTTNLSFMNFVKSAIGK
ncbi:MAG: flagellar biosynthetic protein FliO [Ignavibacteria bacterium]|jgi:flagellar protein FliO/FliZ|nr:flagellar biosynthetic protein FliO [Ignavibacteria bacterium]